LRDDVDPWTIITPGKIPISSVWTVPVSVIEKNIKLNIGNEIDICFRYEHYLRRSRNHHGRWRDIDSYIDVHLSPAFGDIYEKDENNRKHNQKRCLLLHMRSSFRNKVVLPMHSKIIACDVCIFKYDRDKRLILPRL